MDSSTLLNYYQTQIALAITFDYGSKHNAKEIAFAKQMCSELRIEHLIIDLKPVFLNFKSDLLLTGGEIPEGHYEDTTMKRTVVPFRNGVMLSIATGITESRGMGKIFIANHAGDHAIYPDCREDFTTAMKIAIYKGTEKNIELESPFCTWTKRQIALLGKKINFDFSKTYSCYKGGETHCGKCGTCVERKEALLGFDHTIYEQ